MKDSRKLKIQFCYNIVCIISSFNNKIIVICKEIEKYDLYSGTNQLIEIVVGIRYWSVCVLLLQYIHLLKEIVFKQIKGNMMTMSQ